MPYKDPVVAREKQRGYDRKWARNNREQLNKKERAWRIKNPDYYPAKARRYRKDNPVKCKNIARVSRYKIAYGITLEDYDAMFDAQNGLCAVCRRPEWVKLKRGGVRRLAVDHNHTTGKTRSLLCSGCNTALGLLQEDPLRIQALLTYVESND